jgi:acyl carrier protein
MSHTQWDRTVRSKVDASWNLHELLPAALDFFVMLSSISGVVGNAGQANYAAGCTFQDALASHRVRQGHKAVSIDLGVMRDVGVVAENEMINKRLQQSLGLRQVEQRELLATLDRYCDPSLALLSSEKSQVTMGVTTPVDFLKRGLEVPETVQSPLFSFFSQARGSSGGSGAGGGDSAVAQFRRSNSARQRADIVVESLSQKLARALSVQPGDIEAAKPLHAFGVDSLIAVELRNWLTKEFSSDVPVYELTGGRSVLAIGELVERTSQFKRETQQEEGNMDN